MAISTLEHVAEAQPTTPKDQTTKKRPNRLAALHDMFYSINDITQHRPLPSVEKALEARFHVDGGYGFAAPGEIAKILTRPDLEKTRSGEAEGIPLNHDLFTRLNSALGEDLNGVDYNALGDVLAIMMLDAKILKILRPQLAEMMRPSLGDFARTEKGARLIHNMIDAEIYTSADKMDLVRLLPDLSKWDWGGYAIGSMVEKNILTLVDKKTLKGLMEILDTTTGGKAAMRTMEQKGIFTPVEVVMLLNKARRGLRHLFEQQ